MVRASMLQPGQPRPRREKPAWRAGILPSYEPGTPAPWPVTSAPPPKTIGLTCAVAANRL